MLTLSFIPGDWTLHALGMSGVVATLLMQRYATPERPGRFAAILCALGAVMLILALLCHPHWIISKIQATPTWLFYCLAMFFPLFGCFGLRRCRYLFPGENHLRFRWVISDKFQQFIHPDNEARFILSDKLH